jgi:hypothetical protein
MPWGSKTCLGPPSRAAAPSAAYGYAHRLSIGGRSKGSANKVAGSSASPIIRESSRAASASVLRVLSWRLLLPNNPAPLPLPLVLERALASLGLTSPQLKKPPKLCSSASAPVVVPVLPPIPAPAAAPARLPGMGTEEERLW